MFVFALFTLYYFQFAPPSPQEDHLNEFPVSDPSKQIRGLGTDVALVSSMVFLAQFILSAFVGSVIGLVGSTVAVVVAAAFLSFCGALMATQVVYLDL